jgi:hypothetical protein
MTDSSLTGGGGGAAAFLARGPSTDVNGAFLAGPFLA